MAPFGQYADEQKQLNLKNLEQIIRDARKQYNGKTNTTPIKWSNGQLEFSDLVQQICAEATIQYVIDLKQTKEADQDPVKSFLGVNSRENYNPVRVTQRLDQLKEFRKLCADHNKSVLDQFFTGDAYKALCNMLHQDEVQAYCKEIRTYRDAAKVCKLCLEKATSKDLETLANWMEEHASENVPAIGEIYQILTALEQIAGVKEGPLDLKVIDLLQSKFGLQIPSDIPTGSQVPRIIPDTLEFGMPDAAVYQAIRLQEEISKPENSGKSLDKILKPENLGKIDCTVGKNGLVEFIRQGTVPAVQNALTALFGPVEMGAETRSIDGPNRGTLLIVDGKTVGELMQERYIKEVKSGFSINECEKALKGGDWFRQWYHRNLDELSAEFVADALMKGKPVEAYVLGPDRKMRQQPVQLKFDEQVEALLEIHESLEQPNEDMEAARERLRANFRAMEAKRLDPSSTFARDLFLGPYLPLALYREQIVRANPAMVPICIGTVAAYHSKNIDAIMDPTQQQEARGMAVAEYIKHKDDSQWQGRRIFYEQYVLLKQINQTMDGKDLTDPKVRQEVFPQIYPAVRAVSDMLQYMEVHEEVKSGYFAAIRDAAKKTEEDEAKVEAKIDQWYEDTMRQVRNVSALCNLVKRADAFRAAMSRPLSFLNEGDMSAGLAAQLAERYIFQYYEFDAEEKFTEQCPTSNSIRGVEYRFKGTKGHEENAQRLARGWKDWKKGAEYVLSERIADGVMSICKGADFEILDGSLDGSEDAKELAQMEMKVFQYPTRLADNLKKMTNPPPQLETTYHIGFGPC